MKRCWMPCSSLLVFMHWRNSTAWSQSRKPWNHVWKRCQTSGFLHMLVQEVSEVDHKCLTSIINLHTALCEAFIEQNSGDYYCLKADGRTSLSKKLDLISCKWSWRCVQACSPVLFVNDYSRMCFVSVVYPTQIYVLSWLYLHAYVPIPKSTWNTHFTFIMWHNY